jgi:hypothetical protein
MSTMYIDPKKPFTERFRALKPAGVNTIRASVRVHGPWENLPFIIRFLDPSERVDENNDFEFEAVDCNHRIIAFMMEGILKWDNFLVVKNEAEGEPLTWAILDCLANFANFLHDAGKLLPFPPSITY